MNQCKKCGAEFEGNFCPMCGTPYGETAKAPEAPATPEPKPQGGRGKLYRIAALLPVFLCALFSVLALLFCLLPYAVMKLGGESESLGSMYKTGGAAVRGIIAFGAIGLAVALLGLAFACSKRLAWRELFRRPVAHVLAVPAYAVWLGAFACACAICADVSKTDGGMGLLGVGAGPILILVFALLFALLSAGAQLARVFLGKKDPSLAQAEKAAREALRAKYAKEPADNYADEAVAAHIRTMLRLKKFSFLCAISLFSGPAAPVTWVMALVALFKKPDVKKETAAPAEFFRGVRSKMIASAVWNLFTAIATTFVLIFVPCFAVTVGETSIKPWTRSSLQIGGLLSYLPPSIATPVGVIMFLAFGTLAALCIASAVYCKKAPEKLTTQTPVCELQEAVAGAPSLPAVRRAKKLLPCMVLADVLAAAIGITVTVTTNIFTPEKLGKIALGASQSRVEHVLGSTENELPREWIYYSDNVKAMQKREEKLEADMAQALLNNDLKRLEKLTAESEKLAKERETMKYITIRVLFDGEGAVSRIEMFDGESGVYVPPEHGSMRTGKATLSKSRLTLAEAQGLLNGTTEIAYTVKFDDKDYVKDSLLAPQVYADEGFTTEAEFENAGTYYLKWTDSFGNCTAVLEVV